MNDKHLTGTVTLSFEDELVEIYFNIDTGDLKAAYESASSNDEIYINLKDKLTLSSDHPGMRMIDSIVEWAFITFHEDGFRVVVSTYGHFPIFTIMDMDRKDYYLIGVESY
ncbi:hypothetical protein [Hydrogenovibrio marinus]|uniref:Uncharacterized protein n=1 Tax=Hydrogenovibrio marinus TaxID=28885 RepID=A0A066ZXD3_HYDMR|nr:hypothetical protein [Hydrogenovibrio marinus]KDN94740.1 hypothetical protein EI16_12665 [Hydrogenovibrio marinus]